MEKSCATDFLYLGFLEGERALSVIRLLCTFVSFSVIASWFHSRPSMGRMMLFFSHWLGGLVHLLGGLALENMVLMCFLGDEDLGVIRLFKFLELAGSNLVAVTNAAIAVNLARIISSDRSGTWAKSPSSPAMVVAYVIVSCAGAASAMPSWNDWFVGGTYLFVEGNSEANKKWVVTSYFLFEAIAAVIMIAVLVFLFTAKNVKLKQALHTNRYNQLHMAVTVLAILVNIVITATSMTVLLGDLSTQEVPTILAAWKMRDVHVAVDSILLSACFPAPSFNWMDDLENDEVTRRSSGQGMEVATV